MSSNLWAKTYDYPVAVTKSDTVDDPAGNFAGLLVSAAGNVVVWTVGGPQASLPLTIAVIAGQILPFPVRRVGLSTTATVLGLVSAIVHQGA
jgi:hypothetical protein